MDFFLLGIQNFNLFLLLFLSSVFPTDFCNHKNVGDMIHMLRSLPIFQFINDAYTVLRHLSVTRCTYYLTSKWLKLETDGHTNNLKELLRLVNLFQRCSKFLLFSTTTTLNTLTGTINRPRASFTFNPV